MTTTALPSNLGLRGFARIGQGVVRAVLILAILVTGGAFSLQLSGLDPRAPVGADSSSIRSQIAIASAIAIILVFGARGWRRWAALTRTNLLVLALPGLAFLSILWAPEPGVASRRALAFLGTVLCGFAIVAYAGRDGALKVVAQATASGVLLSIAYVAVLPNFGVHQVSDGVQSTHVGDWRGLFVHRTALGQLAALTLAIAVHGGSHAFRPVFIRIGVIAAACLCLIESHSGGALLTAVILLMTPPILNLIRHAIARRWLVGLVLMVGIAIVAALLAPLMTPLILQGLGKDITLTGRTDLWRMMLEIAAERPWLGYGYSTGFRDVVAGLVSDRSAFGYVPNAQNGYLDTLLNLGVVGLATALAVLLSTLWRAIRLATPKSENGETILPLLIVVFIAEMNLGEAALISANDIFVLIYVTAVVAVSKGFRSPGRIDPQPPDAGRSARAAGRSR